LHNLAASLRRVFTICYAAIAALAAIVYYLVLVYMIKYQNYGIFLVSVPKPLIYLLAITSAIMFAFGVYAIRSSFMKRAGASASAFGTAATLFTGIIAGCGCSAPIIYGIAALGVSIAEISVLESFIARYSSGIIGAIIAINALLILYYASMVSKIKGSRR